MIPVLVEPTCLSFTDATINTAFKSSIDELNEFVKFIKELHVLFIEFEEKGLSIAITKDLFQIYQTKVPISIYASSHSIQKLAIETLSRKLKNISRVVNVSVESQMEPSFDDDSVQKSGLYKTEVYTHWVNMTGVLFFRKVPPWILKSNRASVFKKSYATLFNSKGDSVDVRVTENFIDIINSQELSFFRIASRISEGGGDNVSCTGTGTHSSMWRRKIRDLSDVPGFERELLSKLIQTGVVLSITFLDFHKRFPAVSSPVLIINRIDDSKPNADVLMCTLRGRGVKLHSQEVCIEVFKGMAKELIEASNGEISIQFLDNLLRTAAATREG